MVSVIGSARGAVLEVLAGSTSPLSGRRVAGLTRGRVSQTQVNAILRQLTVAGLVLCEEQPPAKLYRLNRQHLAAPGIEALAGLRVVLIRRLGELLTQWPVPPLAAWLFGSAARGDGDERSDVDLLLVRPPDVDVDDARWNQQAAELTDHVTSWTGNSCHLVELSLSELLGAAERQERLIDELRRDAVVLTGPSIQTLLRHSARPTGDGRVGLR